MRSGASSIHQALTTEAASVLKLSLNLARRRGHAHVTPLHVATTLLTSSSSSSSNLLRRACLKSHPHHLTSHHLQCRALELCFNVALNRLPTTPPPSSVSLIQAQPSLSNALIAALKRAQAHQRRGFIEHHHHHHHQQQQQQPLLAIKVELEQLIISILDDPSVSRVMREAGFSSTTVKTNLEEESSVFFDPNREGQGLITSASFLHTHFLKPSLEQNPSPHFSIKEEIKVVLDVMLRKQGRRSNVLVVGVSVSIAEGVVCELMGRLDRGEVPDELKSSHFIKLHLSYAHLRLMSNMEVDLKVSDLRRKVSSLASQRGSGGVVVYVGDLRWALDEETRDGFKPGEHLIEEIGKLVVELKAMSNNKVWLMATSSYQSYMRCQVKHPSLEDLWALQAVVVPSGGLRLSLQAPSGLDSRATKLTQYPFQILEAKSFHSKEEEDKLNCCAECTTNFDKEASVFNGSNQLPFWLQPQKADINHHRNRLLELRRKWNKLCRHLHYARQSSINLPPSYPSSNPWLSTILTDTKNKTSVEPNSISKSQIKNGDDPKQWLSDVKTTLALGNPLFSDTATSMDQRRGTRVNQRELSQKLLENIPWQSENIPSIAEALLDSQSKNGAWLLVQGTDQIAKRRLARVVAESFYGSTDKLISTNRAEKLIESMKKDPKRVVLIEDIDRATGELIETLSRCIKTGFLKDPFGKEVDLSHGVFILTTSSSTNLDSSNKVLKMKLWFEEASSFGHKRKNSEPGSPSNEEEKKKKLKSNEMGFELDLNICAEDSDLTQEINFDNGLLESIGATITMDEIPGWAHKIKEKFVARLGSGFDGSLVIDPTAAEGLREAMGWFLESEFERWVRDVFELNVVTVKNGGKARLGVVGKDGNVGEFGYLGLVLPNRIHVE